VQFQTLMKVLNHRLLKLQQKEESTIPGSGSEAMGEPGSGEPAMGEPAMGEPGSGEAAMGEPGSGEAAMGEPGSGEAAMGEPGSGEPAMGGPGSRTEDVADSLGDATYSEDLEMALCGTGGLEEVFTTAANLDWGDWEVDPDMCPDFDDYIWELVAGQPLVMCLLPTDHIRVGIECIYTFVDYYEESPITRLADMIERMVDHSAP